jgi:hypothetical protein
MARSAGAPVRRNASEAVGGYDGEPKAAEQGES